MDRTIWLQTLSLSPLGAGIYIHCVTMLRPSLESKINKYITDNQNTSPAWTWLKVLEGTSHRKLHQTCHNQQDEYIKMSNSKNIVSC